MCVCVWIVLAFFFLFQNIKKRRQFINDPVRSMGKVVYRVIIIISSSVTALIKMSRHLGP